MRTTIRLDDQLLRDAKRAAAASGRTFTQLLEDALREVLGRKNGAPTSAAVKLPTFKGTGVRSGVDLDDSSALLDLMEADDAAAGR